MAECNDIRKSPTVDSPVTVSTTLRELTQDEQEKLTKDTKVLTDFKQQKLEKEAQKNWDLFYKRNTTKFFKDRHWTKREFSDLVQKKDGSKLVIFEVGCGVGNFMFPLLDDETNIFFYACDFSKRAVEFVKENPNYDVDRCLAFHCDITQDDLTNHIAPSSVDVATMIFVLSAIHPNKMPQALQKIFQVLKPGGCLLFRDYGLYDHAMLRFAPGHKLSENFYVRQDGTRAYYFTLDKCHELTKAAGFLVANCEYVNRQTVNKKEGINVPRIFVQAKFVKPSVTGTGDGMSQSENVNSPIRTTSDGPTAGQQNCGNLESSNSPAPFSGKSDLLNRGDTSDPKQMCQNLGSNDGERRNGSSFERSEPKDFIEISNPTKISSENCKLVTNDNASDCEELVNRLDQLSPR